MPSSLAAVRHLLAGPPASTLPLAVQRVQVHLLLQKTDPFRLLSPVPFAIPLAVVFHQTWNSFAPLAWALLFVLACGWCFVRRMKLDRDAGIRDADIPAVLRRRTEDIFLLGAMWGLAPWMLDPHGDVAYLTLNALFVVGAVSIGSMIVTTHRQAIAAFSIPAGIGMVSACASFGGPVGWLIASCGALFVVVTLGWAFQQADLLQESLVVRFEKEDLARRLAHQVELFEAANREKTRFFAAASHDLRQPLHAISLFISSLERARLADGEAQTVGQLSNSVQALAHSLDAMLDVSRLDAGAVQPAFEVVPVHELFVSLQNTFEGRAQEKGLHLRMRAPGPLAVLSDRLLLERLLANLVDNAIKYTASGGVLVAARVAPSTHPMQVCFEILDTGIGIPPDQHARIFDEFYQVGNAQRDRRMGLGIGLSIVRRLSELLVHPVTLASRPGRGTRFTVRVPQSTAPALQAPDAARPETAREPSADKLPKHVLVIDDEVDSRQAMATWLASHGCAVSTAGSLPQAEDILRHETVQAVIADFRLPGERSGLDFLVALRSQSPQIRTLLVTGETAPQRITAIRASGVPCLYKPVRAPQLLDALAE